MHQFQRTFLQLSPPMNALQDPSKKTSINSLLNPQESSAFPVGPDHAQSQSHQPSSMFHSMPNYESQSYNLRAASWDPDYDPHKRRPFNGPQNMHRQYQQHPTLPPPPPTHIYADPNASRLIMRPRTDESPMYANEGMWSPKHLPLPPPPPPQQQQQQQHQHAVSGMSYPPPVIYSDERTGILIPQHHFRPGPILITDL